jgi:SAM-dependent methyltransferase
MTDIAHTLRSPNRDHYPELGDYSRDAIYEDSMGGGALYLAAQITRGMAFQPGEIVLDLGCGRGSTSIFLARHFGVRVVAVDLWTSATFLNDKFTARGYRDQITPLHLDATGDLPFAEHYFDAIFCMNSLSFYGGSVAFLAHLLKHLKPGGTIGVGMETLSDEFTEEQIENPPEVYHYHLPGGIDVWEDDFLKMHSPPWWADLFRASGLVDEIACRELEDAAILYEDLVLYEMAHEAMAEDVERSLAQIAWGRAQHPYKTLFTLVARKKA